MKRTLNLYVFRSLISIPLFLILLAELFCSQAEKYNVYLSELRKTLLIFADKYFPIK